MFSQNQEELYISKYFKDHVGIFLDLGAYDGIKLSNTYNLVLKAWKGVCVEASPKVFTMLQSNLKNYNNIELLCACVSVDDHKIIDWYDNSEATATYVMSNVEKWKNETPFTQIKLSTTSVDKILDSFNYDYDFINIDVEGNSVEIFKHIYNRISNVKMICVEHDNMINDISKIAKNHKTFYLNAENIILVIK